VRVLRRVDLGRRQELLRQLDLYLKRLVERLQPQAVVLFGSFAREDVHEGSDIDLLVVAPFQEPFLERIGRLLELGADLGLPLEPVGYRPEEVEAMWRSGNRFLQAAVRTGRLLYGSWTGAVTAHGPQGQ
jgi:predicted nucleotidyltransferase